MSNQYTDSLAMDTFFATGLIYWRLTEKGELQLDIEDKVSARFDIAPLQKSLVEREKERQRVQELNRIALETNGTQIKEPTESSEPPALSLDGVGTGGKVSLLLHQLALNHNKGRFTLNSGSGLLRLDKQALAPLALPQEGGAEAKP